MAVKQLKQHDARNDIRFLREIAILKECRSGHVVQFLVSLLDTQSPLLPSLVLAPVQCHLCKLESPMQGGRADNSLHEPLTMLHVMLACSMERCRVELLNPHYSQETLA